MRQIKIILVILFALLLDAKSQNAEVSITKLRQLVEMWKSTRLKQ